MSRFLWQENILLELGAGRVSWRKERARLFCAPSLGSMIWCSVLSEFGNPTRTFNTGVETYEDAQKVSQTILRLEGII